jgi:hypothetical protein
MGMTVLLLHHTGKAGETIYKGSTAISDLCDHALCLEQIREDALELEGQLFKLETKEKTRFLQSKINLSFGSHGFEKAEDPAIKFGEELKFLMEEMQEENRFQSAIVKQAQEELDWTPKKTRKVLRAGEGRHWYKTEREGKGGKVSYVPV